MANMGPEANASVGSGIFLCPKCGKKSDTATFKDPASSCPFCGSEANAKNNRRREERVKKEIETVLEYRGECVEACSKDLSKGGLCVKTSGEFIGATGESLGLFMGPHRFLARVMWVDKLLNMSTVGLQWKSRLVNRLKQAFFSAASAGGFFYLVFMSCLLIILLYFTFLK